MEKNKTQKHGSNDYSLSDLLYLPVELISIIMLAYPSVEWFMLCKYAYNIAKKSLTPTAVFKDLEETPTIVEYAYSALIIRKEYTFSTIPKTNAYKRIPYIIQKHEKTAVMTFLSYPDLCSQANFIVAALSAIEYKRDDILSALFVGSYPVKLAFNWTTLSILIGLINIGIEREYRNIVLTILTQPGFNDEYARKAISLLKHAYLCGWIDVAKLYISKIHISANKELSLRDRQFIDHLNTTIATTARCSDIINEQATIHELMTNLRSKMFGDDLYWI